MNQVPLLRHVSFKMVDLKGIFTSFPISITLFANFLKWNSSKILNLDSWRNFQFKIHVYCRKIEFSLPRSLKCLIFKLVSSYWLMKIDWWVAQWPDYQRVDQRQSLERAHLLWKIAWTRTQEYIYFYTFVFIYSYETCS